MLQLGKVRYEISIERNTDMKTNLKIAAVAACTFALGFMLNNPALSDIASTRVAVVDVNKVVAGSKQVNALKVEQQNKINSLRSFVATAKQNVSKEKDATKKKALEAKYNKELQNKTAAIEKEYAQKLQAIDANISNVISVSAKAKGYNLVLAKGVVLYGGTDITADVIKSVK